LPDQLIIADASEDRGTEAVIDKFEGRFAGQIEYYGTECGLTRQRNFAVNKARGDVIGFFDDDVVLDPDYLAEIMNVFERDVERTVGGATGYIYNRAANRPILFRLFNEFRDRTYGRIAVAKRRGLTPIPDKPFEDPILVRYVSGCNMFFRKEVFATNEFDQWFEGYGLGEDCEFGLRVSRTWKILAVGKARLDHSKEEAGRPNYAQLGKMCIENHVRILTLARSTRVLSNAIVLMLLQMFGICISSAILFLKFRFRDGLGYTYGGLQGLFAASKFLCNYTNLKRRGL
jgi:GT2 family glycosyltransferase